MRSLVYASYVNILWLVEMWERTEKSDWDIVSAGRIFVHAQAMEKY